MVSEIAKPSQGERGLPRVALVGNLANVAYQTAKFLRRRGVCADVFVGIEELAKPSSDPRNHDPELQHERPEWVKYYSKGDAKSSAAPFRIQKVFRQLPLWRELRRYDLIESFCVTPIWVGYVGKPYISFATGSDLRELVLERSWRGREATKIFQQAEIVFFGPEPSHFERVRALHIRKSYPYRQIIDTETYQPLPTHGAYFNEDELVVFHPSNQDWSYQGTERNPKGLKGNDKLIRAFARYVKEGKKARLILLDRGPDAEKTKSLIAELEIWAKVTILPSMNKKELREYYNAADIVADQFAAGGFGLIGLEAMSCGRPVLVDVDRETIDLCYDEFPPLLNCGTEEEIYQQLVRVSDRSFREEVGKQARQWIMKYHHWEKVIDNLIVHYENVLGRKVV